LKNVSEYLSDMKMKLVVGGYSYDATPCGFCKEDEECDWYYLSCVKKSTAPTPKIDACKGKNTLDQCFWTDANNFTHKGRCLQTGLPGELHCSDLN